ncbi:MAG: glycosyltransferase [Waltera sp.]
MADREKGKNMRISVAMATYNGARFITEQLDSIRLQSLPVDQVILRDDGSSDQTLEIVREYLETYELAPAWRITQNGKRLGYAENFRAAVEETDGDYVFFCDQDDIWEPDRVEDMVSEMEKRREILVLGSEFVPFTVDPDAPSVSRSVLKSFRGTEAWSMLHGVRPIFSSAVRAVPCVCAESSWKRRRSTGIPGGRMMNMPGSCPCAWTAVTFCIVLRYGGECTRVMYPNARCGIWTDGSLFSGNCRKVMKPLCGSPRTLECRRKRRNC